MATNSIYSLRDFRFKMAADSTYRETPSFVTRQREITGSNTATLSLDFQLTSSQSALTINFGDLSVARSFYAETDGSVKLVLNSSASLIIGLTSASATVGKPMFYCESSITSATVTNRIAKQTQFKVRAAGVTA